jgi:hypothetical protein
MLKIQKAMAKMPEHIAKYRSEVLGKRKVLNTSFLDPFKQIILASGKTKEATTKRKVKPKQLAQGKNAKGSKKGRGDQRNQQQRGKAKKK